MNYARNYNIKLQYESMRDKSQTKLKDFNIHFAILKDSEMQGNKKTMVSINEIAPVVPLFEGATKIEKKDVVNKKLIIDAFSELEGDDGKYGVIRFILDGETYTTSISGMLLERILEASQKIGLNVELSTNKEKVLANTIEVVIIEKESTKNKNRTYFDFE